VRERQEFQVFKGFYFLDIHVFFPELLLVKRTAFNNTSEQVLQFCKGIFFREIWVIELDIRIELRITDASYI
jgi:hypothetical protein